MLVDGVPVLDEQLGVAKGGGVVDRVSGEWREQQRHRDGGTHKRLVGIRDHAQTVDP
jgi:hypothetical protein